MNNNNENIVRESVLSDGVRAVIRDVSNHYYGGYYHVRLQITAEIPLRSYCFGSVAEYEDALRRLGPAVCFKRTLEKMAVPASDVDAVRNGLLESFEANVLSYLHRPDFPSCFVKREYETACKSTVNKTYIRS